MKKLTCHQKQKYIQTMIKGVKKQIEVTINKLAKKGVLNADNFPRITVRGDRGDSIIPAVTETIERHLANIADSVVNRVKLVRDDLELDKIDGNTEELEKVKDFYKRKVHREYDHEFYRELKISPTKRAKVSVYDLIMDGTYTEIFGGMSGYIDRLCLTESQFVQFVMKHEKYLFMEGYGTFFPVKYGKKFFVMNVNFDNIGYLLLGRDRLSDDNLSQWSAKECRFVVLKQVLAN